MFSQVPNLQIHEFFSQFFSCFLLKQDRIFLSRSKMLLKLCNSFKKIQDIFREKKSWIRRFGIREDMS